MSQPGFLSRGALGLALALVAFACSSDEVTDPQPTAPPVQLGFSPISDPAARTDFVATVQIQNASGNLVSTATGDVTLAFGTNAGTLLFHGSETFLDLVDWAGATVLPGLANAATSELTALTYNGTTAQVFGITLDDRLTTYDVATGLETDIGENAVVGGGGATEQLTGIAFESGGRLLGVARDNDTLWDVDVGTGAITGIGTITIANDPTEVVEGATGLAIDPTSGTMYVVLKIASLSNPERILATLDAGTSVATTIGQLTEDGVADITITPDGTLLGVTGDGAPTPREVWTIDRATGSMTSAVALGENGSDGEAITWIPATLTGTLTVAAVNGVATFNGLQISAVGTGYTLTATSPNLSDGTSSAFNVTP